MEGNDISNIRIWNLLAFTPDLVSVIIPTYNRVTLISETLNSIINQTYRPIECIVIDDGSTDNTKKVVESYIEKDHQNISINYLYQNNSGAQVARNTGTLASKGEFIQYLDSDDILYPEKLKKQVAFLHKNTDCDGVFGNWDKGQPDKKEHFKTYESDDLICQFLGEFCIANFSFLMRRSIVHKIGPWDTKIKRNQEIDFHLRGVIERGKFKYQNINCGLWRVHSGERIVSSTGLKHIIFFYEKWIDQLSIKNLLDSDTKKIISDNLIWNVFANKNAPVSLKIKAINKAIKLNKEANYFNTKKMRILRAFLGNRLAIMLWLNKYKKSKSIKNQDVND